MRGTSFLVGLMLAGVAAWVTLAGDSWPETPDDKLTPGEIATTDGAEICGWVDGKSYSQRHRLPFDIERARRVFDRYGIDPHLHGQFELDHRVPLCLGGADTEKNLWPQPRKGPWTAEMKDRLEAHMCKKMCEYTNGSSLGWSLVRGIQSYFLEDWREGYREIFK